MAANEPTQIVRLTQEQLHSLVRETVHETLVSLGMEAQDPLEMQRDFQHLRDWRVATDTAKRRSMQTALGILLTGVFGLLWMGISKFIQQLGNGVQ